MGYRIGYNGPQVDDLLQKGYKYSVINNGWTKLESSDLAATNLDTLVTPGNYSTSFWQNGPIQLVTNGPINVCVTKDSSSNTLYQTIYDAGKIYIRSTTSTSFSNTWREEQNNSSLEIGASTPVNPSDNYIWIDTSGDAPVIKIYKENRGEWVAVSAADLAKKSVYDKNNVGKPFTTYLDEKIAEGDLATAENTYKKHIVEGEDTGNPIHVTSEEKLKWNAGISTSEADTLINKFKKDMQSYADEKVNTSSTKINDLTTEVNDQKKIMDNHMGDNTIHLTADQVTAFDNKAAGDHTHLNDGTVTVSTTNLTGLIPIERLDPSVLERNYTVSSYDDLFNLTKNEVQNGDSVYVNETHPSAWFVVDDSKLGEYNYDFTWKESSFPNVNNWVKFCYGNGKLIVISGDITPRTPNVFAYSSDGINWTEGNIPSDCNKIHWVSIRYGNGRFIVVGWHINYYLYSTDGINWIKGILPSSQTWNDVCYGNDKYVIIAQNTTSFVYSTDGINWTEGNMPSKRTWYKLCYGNDKFVAISRLNGNINSVFAYSSDGINWTESDSPSNQKWNDICYGDGKFVAIVFGSNIFAYSTDGINWTEGNMPMTLSWDSIVYNSTDHLFVSLGTMVIPKTESQQYDNYTYIAYSKDGIKWSHMIMSKENHYISIYCMNGNYLAILNVQRGDNWSASYLYYDKFVYSPLTKFPTALVQYAAPTPELTWGNITNKPTTISDYGLSNTYYTADEINALYNRYKTQYDEINKSVSDITDSLLEIPEDLSTTYDTNLARASALNKKLDNLLHSLGLNDKMISDMVNMYKERSIIYRSSLDTGIDFDSLTVGSTFMLGKYQVESEDPWDIEWEIVHQTNDYQIAMTKQIIDLRCFDGIEPTNTDSDRKSAGNNNWQYSNIEQFLNSDQASWYSVQHQYDAPPTSDNVYHYNNGTTYNAYDTHKGFLYYWSADEKVLLKDMTLTLANNTITDGGGSYTWTGKVWLPTYTQMGGGQNNSISEGEAFSKFTDNASRLKSLHDMCITNNEYCKINNHINGNWDYWMSSVHPSSSAQVCNVNSGGSLGASNLVYTGYFGFAPCICLPRHGKYAGETHDPSKKTVTIKYSYLNPSSDKLPAEVINNKPTGESFTFDILNDADKAYTHNIDDTHYPSGQVVDAEDGSGYWTFSGWNTDDATIK